MVTLTSEGRALKKERCAFEIKRQFRCTLRLKLLQVFCCRLSVGQFDQVQKAILDLKWFKEFFEFYNRG